MVYYKSFQPNRQKNYVQLIKCMVVVASNRVKGDGRRCMVHGGWWPPRPLGSIVLAAVIVCVKCDDMLDILILPVRPVIALGIALERNQIDIHQTEISRSLNKFPGTDDYYLANVFWFPKSGPAPVVIWNDWNFFNIYKNSHVCYFSIWFYFLEGGLTPAAIFPLASAQSSFLSLWCNFFPKLSFTEWTSFFSLLISKNFPRLDWLDCALFLGSFG